MRMTSHSRSTERSSTGVASRLNLKNSAELDRKASDYSTRQIDPSTFAQDREGFEHNKADQPFPSACLTARRSFDTLASFPQRPFGPCHPSRLFQFYPHPVSADKFLAGNKLADSSHQSQSFFA